VLGNHMGPVHCVHYDLYKVISGGPSDREVHVWNAETGDEISTLDCAVAASSSVNVGVSALVGNGGKLVTGTCGEDPGVVRLQDFSNCVNPLVECETEVSNKHSGTSKFWESVFNTML
jgi:WD40 repeat protein